MDQLEFPSPHVPHYPNYDKVRWFVRLVAGYPKATYFSMRSTIFSHSGTPQQNRDWSNPDEWILQILDGPEAELALRLWSESGRVVNPRHDILAPWLLASRYGLLDATSDDELYITDLGHDFINNPLGDTVQWVDYKEGLLELLKVTSEHGPGKRSDFLPHYTEFLDRFSNYASRTSKSNAWRNRISNLAERGLTLRSGVTHEITETGLQYLEATEHLSQQTPKEPEIATQTQIRRLLKEQGDEVRTRVRETLVNMDPFRLEHLIKQLLEAMEYQNVEVTSRSGDGGVDVVADIEVGITPVREVIQVKRHKSNIQRRVLDELRGSLHRFDATRGTIISTSDFARGAKESAFERGAAPITLIDGDRLIELLIEQEIGVRKRSVQFLEFEAADFADIEEDDQE